MIIGVYNDRNHPLTCLSPIRINEYLRVAKELGITLAFFDIRDVNLEQRRIQAKILNGLGLVSEVIDFPTLAINEGAAIDKHKLDAEKEKAFRKDVQFLSHLIDNKLVVNEILGQAVTIQPHLIPTKFLTSFKPFLEMDVRERILVKPHDGRKGQGIVVIEKLNKGKFLLNEQGSRRILVLNEMKKICTSWVKQKNYLIQPFIVSTTPAGHTFHLRTHICRGAQAEWHVIAAIADVAEAGRLTSNYDGAETRWAMNFLNEEFGEHGGTIHQQLLKITACIADQLEQHYPFTLNELAMDFGLTSDGHLYFFEANTGPEVVSFAGEREKARAEHKLAYALQVHQAIEKVPVEDRRGLVFKVSM